MLDSVRPFNLTFIQKEKASSERDAFDYALIYRFYTERTANYQRPWSFSGLATMVRITLMEYVDFYSLFNFLEKDWEDILAKTGQRFMEQLLLFG